MIAQFNDIHSIISRHKSIRVINQDVLLMKFNVVYVHKYIKLSEI